MGLGGGPRHRGAFPGSPLPELARALVYRGELALRLGDGDLARSSRREARSLALDEEDRRLIEEELAQLAELLEAGRAG